jgi:DNA-binding MurR/RpiR family transcriptional regulator
MSESSLKVAKFIVENPKRVASMSIGELAKATGSNKSAVVRVFELASSAVIKDIVDCASP